jgi:hypothetical protein
MDWVKKRIKERDAKRQRGEKIESGTEPIWKSLCQALKDSIAVYREATNIGRFEEDGRNHHLYWVRYVEDTPNRNTEKKKVIITLDASESSITATYEGVDYRPRSVTLDVENGDVYLRNEEKGLLQSADVAAYFLDPFLFPDLAQTPLPKVSVYEKGGLKSL